MPPSATFSGMYCLTRQQPSAQVERRKAGSPHASISLAVDLHRRSLLNSTNSNIAEAIEECMESAALFELAGKSARKIRYRLYHDLYGMYMLLQNDSVNWRLVQKYCQETFNRSFSDRKKGLAVAHLAFSCVEQPDPKDISFSARVLAALENEGLATSSVIARLVEVGAKELVRLHVARKCGADFPAEASGASQDGEQDNETHFEEAKEEHEVQADDDTPDVDGDGFPIQAYEHNEFHVPFHEKTDRVDNEQVQFDPELHILIEMPMSDLHRAFKSGVRMLRIDADVLELYKGEHVRVRSTRLLTK